MVILGFKDAATPSRAIWTGVVDALSDVDVTDHGVVCLLTLMFGAAMGEEAPRGFDPAIRAYYEQAPEERRLESGAFRLEAVRTRELIQRHVPPRRRPCWTWVALAACMPFGLPSSAIACI